MGPRVPPVLWLLYMSYEWREAGPEGSTYARPWMRRARISFEYVIFFHQYSALTHGTTLSVLWRFFAAMLGPQIEPNVAMKSRGCHRSLLSVCCRLEAIKADGDGPRLYQLF